MKTILIVDDDRLMLSALARTFRGNGWGVLVADSPDGLSQSMAKADVVLTDWNMGHWDGGHVVNVAQSMGGKPVVVWSGDPSEVSKEVKELCPVFQKGRHEGMTQLLEDLAKGVSDA